MDLQQKIETLRRELRDAVGNRAQTMFFVFDELRALCGEQPGLKLLKRALYRQGYSAGQQYRVRMPGGRTPTPQEYADMATRLSADEGSLFPLDIRRADAQRCDAKVLGCPAKDALIATGVSPADFELVTQAMDAWTYGVVEGIGLGYYSEPPKWGVPGCCFMHVVVPGHPDAAAARKNHPLEGNPLREPASTP